MSRDNAYYQFYKNAPTKGFKRTSVSTAYLWYWEVWKQNDKAFLLLKNVRTDPKRRKNESDNHPIVEKLPTHPCKPTLCLSTSGSILTPGPRFCWVKNEIKIPFSTWRPCLKNWVWHSSADSNRQVVAHGRDVCLRAQYRTCLLFLPVSSSSKEVRVSLSLVARREVLKSLWRNQTVQSWQRCKKNSFFINISENNIWCIPSFKEELVTLM